MQYKLKLFLDDERDPVTHDWIVCRSSRDAIGFVGVYGIPNEISFDHDLGGDDTSIIFLDFLISQILDGNLVVPEDFKWYIHSQNPIGASNIEGKCQDILRISKMLSEGS